MFIASLIPARGGSKSIPYKNIREVGGKPLLWHSVQYSLTSTVTDYTFVSTDNKRIRDVALDAGASVPFLRPAELATDDARDFPVALHALESLEEYLNTQIDIIVLLRPTSPLRPSGLIEKSLDLLRLNPSGTSVRSITPSKEHPFRQWLMNDAEIMSPFITDVEAEPFNVPRQALPQYFFQTGDIEVIRRSTILEGSITGANPLGLVIDRSEMLDIDHEIDIRDAEQKYSLQKS